MKNFIFATVSGFALLIAQGAVAKENTATPSTTMEKKESHKHTAKTSQKHRKHHARHGKMMHPAQIGGVYVVFPPVVTNGCDTCAAQAAPHYYSGRQDCPYMYHGGYFWYPDAQGTMLKGYTPYQVEGKYWYASRLHPHTVYVERAPRVYAYPYPMQAPNPMDDELYEMQTSPMAKKWDSAPDKQGASAN